MPILWLTGFVNNQYEVNAISGKVPFRGGGNGGGGICPLGICTHHDIPNSCCHPFS